MIDKKPVLPTELLLSVFAFLDGFSLTTCGSVCRHWAAVIQHYDDFIWSACARRDFQKSTVRRFWSLEFPDPSLNKMNRTWKDMYRITSNWYKGNHTGYFPSLDAPDEQPLCAVVGSPRDSMFPTYLSVTATGEVVRSNPVYRNTAGWLTLVVQCPKTGQGQYMDDRSEQGQGHGIVCHYSDLSSHWLVSGGLDGTVALWDAYKRCRIKTWNGHRGRVLCVAMNNQGKLIVSGGSDGMIRVWDLQSIIKGAPGHTSRRGMIDISSYLSGRHDWFQGVGEIAVTGHLVACAPDATGPILVFSLLTGSLVYELKTTDSASLNEDVTAFTKLCMTPFFLLTKGKVKPSPDEPAPPAVLTQLGSREGLTPYQLYRSYQTNGMVHTRACVNVWDLQTGKLAYRLVPVLEKPASYTITDIRLSPDYSKVFACLEIQGRECKEQLYCWDFSESSKGVGDKKQLRIVQIDDVSPRRSTGKSWACFM